MGEKVSILTESTIEKINDYKIVVLPEMTHTSETVLEELKKYVDKHCDWSEEEQAILLNSTGSYAQGVHETWIFGDYYFVEAMYKLKGFEPMFW